MNHRFNDQRLRLAAIYRGVILIALDDYITCASDRLFKIFFAKQVYYCREAWVPRQDASLRERPC